MIRYARDLPTVEAFCERYATYGAIAEGWRDGEASSLRILRHGIRIMEVVAVGDEALGALEIDGTSAETAKTTSRTAIRLKLSDAHHNGWTTFRDAEVQTHPLTATNAIKR